MGEGEGGMIWENSTETYILSSVKQITSPGRMHETSAQGWCTGKTQRDGMGREVGGGSRWGTHVNPWLTHVNVWQKPLKYCKITSLQLIKINEKKRKKKMWMSTNLLSRWKASPWGVQVPLTLISTQFLLLLLYWDASCYLMVIFKKCLLE